MTTFGDTLRSFRQASNDPDRLNRRLTQERLGELIGHEMGDYGFTGAAISDWERGESKINAADRSVLIALLVVFHKCGSLHTIAEANQFLVYGNYRALDEKEIQRIFGNPQSEWNAGSARSEEKSSDSDRVLLLASVFSIPKEEFKELLIAAQEGPPPIWPRLLAAFMHKASDRLSFSLNTVLWIWVWLFTWWLIGPSLRLPYANRDVAFRALSMYAIGSVMIPLLIGLLVNTNNNEFWKSQSQIKSSLLRLYTYQGAGTGFNVGYFLVFPIALILYYFHLTPSIGVEFLAVTVSLILGNMAARVVPYNLLRAYGRLTFKEGAIFFSVALVGLFWAFFFFQYYSLFLTPLWGTLIILTVLTILGFGVRYQARKPASSDHS